MEAEEDPTTYNKIVKYLTDGNADFKILVHRPTHTSQEVCSPHLASIGAL